MKPRTLKYHIKKGSKNIVKNRLMSIASIASVFVCSFILIISLAIAINLSNNLENLEKTMGISIYLGEDMSDSEVQSVLNKLQNIKYVSRIEYMSKDDALNWAKDELLDNDILKGFEKDNPFPRSFEVYIEDGKKQQFILDEIEKIQLDIEKGIIQNKYKDDEKTKNEQIQKIGQSDYEYSGIYKVKHTQKETSILLTINNTIRATSIVMLLILSIISVTIIVNTIKLTVYIRKTEISIMKYVGATDWFIRFPFLIEGIIIGLIGSVLSIVVSMLLYSEAVNLITNRLSNMNGYIQIESTYNLFLAIGPIALILGAVLGVIGSLHSIKKYLSV